MDVDTITAPSNSALTSGHKIVPNSTEYAATPQWIPYVTEQLVHIAPLNLTLCLLACFPPEQFHYPPLLLHLYSSLVLSLHDYCSSGLCYCGGACLFHN